MVYKVADNICSPLGVTTAENYAAVKAGGSMLRSYPAGTMDLPYAFMASLIDWGGVELLAGYTRFERIVIQSVSRALQQTTLDAHSPRLLFVLATTKGNVELLEHHPLHAKAKDDAGLLEYHPLQANAKGNEEQSQTSRARILPGMAAQAVADYFGFVNTPLVVSNACISGLSAQLTAQRLLEGGAYDVAVVCGADVLSRFVVSGFGSLMSLSPAACRPFDMERTGLNLGEAAATIIYKRGEGQEVSGERRAVNGEGQAVSGGSAVWQIMRGAVCNDAFHISRPSPKGEGCYRAIRAAMDDLAVGELAFVSAHGTATMYNDEMESAAIARAGLAGVTVNSLKGYFGHTMGAAGVLETVLSMAAVDDGGILGTRGFEELGVSHTINVTAGHQATTKRTFLKLMSGFGGCNAAAVFKKTGGDDDR